MWHASHTIIHVMPGVKNWKYLICGSWEHININNFSLKHLELKQRLKNKKYAIFCEKILYYNSLIKVITNKLWNLIKHGSMNIIKYLEICNIISNFVQR